MLKRWIAWAREITWSLREWHVEREIARELCSGMVALPEYRNVPLPVLRDLAKLHTTAYFTAYSIRLSGLDVASETDLETADRESDRFADMVLELACRGEATEEAQPARTGGRGQRNQRGPRSARSMRSH